MNTKLTIIICTYNRLRKATKLAAHPEFKKKDLEVLIINQGKQTQLKKSSQYRLIIAPKVSLPAARNLGIEEARGEIVLFLDDDTEPANGLVKHHLNAYKNKSISSVAGRVINDSENVSEKTDVDTGLMNKFGTSFTQSFYSTKKQYVDFPYGCNMSFRKEVINTIGKFDVHYLPPLSAFEEIDLALRVNRLGKILFEPKALVIHYQTAIGGTRTRLINKHHQYSYCYGYFLAKNIPLSRLGISFLIATKRTIMESPTSLPWLIFGCSLHYRIRAKKFYSQTRNFIFYLLFFRKDTLMSSV